MMKALAIVSLLLGGLVLTGCGSDDASMKPADSIANDLKSAGPATGEVGGKGNMKKPGN